MCVCVCICKFCRLNTLYGFVASSYILCWYRSIIYYNVFCTQRVIMNTIGYCLQVFTSLCYLTSTSVSCINMIHSVRLVLW